MDSNMDMHMPMGGMQGGPACKIDMLWNWYTIDACFLAKSWHVTSRGMFAGSCIGVVLLGVLLEFLRRLGREYDAFILNRARLRSKYMVPQSPRSGSYSTSKLSLHQDQDVEPGNNKDNAAAEIFPHDHQDGNVSSSHRASVNPNASANGAKNETTTSTAGTGFNNKCQTDKRVYRPSLMEHLVRSMLHISQFALAYIIMLLAMYFNGYIIICIFIGVFLGALVFSWEPLNLNKE
ncbi:hypothetical protein N7535_001150 [Penicillium sp. DV-2018c]|nr:hypothetical protein N7461_005610 [Penicillium sp. DV-2018c]KAJ5582530.1 hypothetical protein N7535_001150 [Penicillium sp. DV-2018c]